MEKIDLRDIGLSQRFINEATLYEGLYIGRVISQYKSIYKVMTENGELSSEVSGKFRYNVNTTSEYPAVGDFVMVDRIDDGGGNAIIHHVLTRKSVFIRKAAGTSNDEQVVAANIDTVFICMSLNKDLNVRRIERYLGIAWDGGAIPVIVLTKSDLCDDISEKMTELESVASGVDIVVTSSVEEGGYRPITDYVTSGKTVAFIGSSGVGKSTLINRLIGKDVIKTNGIREDDKGRHTTTRRQMYILPNGGVVIDTPGMREIGIESANLSKAFADIDELAKSCKFNDCTHTSEPKCAVREAIDEGLLSLDRFNNYVKLKKEAKYEGLNSRQIEREKFDEMFKDVGGMKGGKKLIREMKKSKGKI